MYVVLLKLGKIVMKKKPDILVITFVESLSFPLTIFLLWMEFPDIWTHQFPPIWQGDNSF